MLVIKHKQAAVYVHDDAAKSLQHFDQVILLLSHLRPGLVNPVSMGFAAVRDEFRECCTLQHDLHGLTWLEVLPYMLR